MMASRQELAVRRAVREAVALLPAGSPVLVACSGGADSLALAAAAAFVCPRDGRPAGGVTVDHGLQGGSAERARAVATGLAGFGLDPVEVIHVPAAGHLRHGPEGNARLRRYTALDAAADRSGAAAVLLGHTRDDQAETVLLGLARGSGARSLAGMAASAGRYLRPLLALPREVVRAAVPAGVKPWDDPHNADVAYARARVRHRVLPTLEAELGPGVGDALARTADLMRADADALDEWAEQVFDDAVLDADVAVARVEEAAVGLGGSRSDDAGDGALRVDVLADVPKAVRFRVLRKAALAAGSPASDLTAAHVAAVDALVTRWTGQRGIDLPGRVTAMRSGGVVRFGGGSQERTM
jgi:tRNA(Ile)-lysidine synthase